MSTPHNRPVGQGRAAGSVSGQICWDQVHGGLTRYRGTVTSFAWPTKVLIGAPPWLSLAWWAWLGVFNHPLFALVFAVPLTWAAVWWTLQVWGRHAGSPHPDRRPVRTAAAGVYPDHRRPQPHLTLGDENPGAGPLGPVRRPLR